MIYVPRPHDKLGIHHLVDREEALLFAEMGTGKTGITIAALIELLCDGAISGALVVAPKRVATLSWPNEVEKWENFRWLRVANLRTKEGWAMLEAGTAHIYAINYDQLASREVVRKVKRPATDKELSDFSNGRLPFYCKLPRGIDAEDALMTGVPPPGAFFFDEVPEYYPGVVERYFFNRRKPPAFDVVVFDESTKVKNPQSKVAAAFRPYRRKIQRWWGLTGTPRPEGLMDLFGQVKIIDQGKRLGPAKTNFEQVYFQPDFTGWKIEPREGAEEQVMAKIADMTLVLRAKDWMDVPEAEVYEIEVELPKSARRIYDELEEQLLAILENQKEIVAVNAGALLTKLIQMVGGAVYDELKHVHVIHDAKIEALKKLVNQIKEPVMIGYVYQHEKDRILKAVPGCVEWDDSVLDRWNRGEIPALMAHPASIGHGLNLWEGGRTIIWYSRNYHRELYDQLCGRFVGARASLSGKVPQIYHLVSPNTVDEAVDEALRLKAAGQSGLMAALSSMLKRSREEQ